MDQELETFRQTKIQTMFQQLNTTTHCTHLLKLDCFPLIWLVGLKELDNLYEFWKAQAEGQETIQRTQFEQGLQEIGVTDPVVLLMVLDELSATALSSLANMNMKSFNAFDTDNNGAIDFREFVAGLSTLQRGTAEERLRCMPSCSFHTSLSLWSSCCVVAFTQFTANAPYSYVQGL